MAGLVEATTGQHATEDPVLIDQHVRPGFAVGRSLGRVNSYENERIATSAALIKKLQQFCRIQS